MSSYNNSGWSNKRSSKIRGGSRGGSRGDSKGGSKQTHSNYYSPKEWNALSVDDKAKIRLKRQKSSRNGQAGSSDSRGVQSVDTDYNDTAKTASNTESNAGSQFGFNAYSKKQTK